MNLQERDNDKDSAGESIPTTGKNPSDNILHHFWHAVARSQDLTDRPLAVKLLDHPVVIWRSQNGVVPS